MQTVQEFLRPANIFKNVLWTFIVGALFLGGGLVVGFWKDLWSGIGRFPRPLQVSLGIGVLLLVIGLFRVRRQLWAWLRTLFRPAAQPGSSGPSFTGIAAGDNANISTVATSFEQIFVPPLLRPPVAITPEALRQTAEKLRALGIELDTFLISDEAAPPADLPATGRLTNDDLQKHTDEWKAYSLRIGRLYRERFNPRLCVAALEARALGFVDEELDRGLSTATRTASEPLDWLRRTAQKAQILALQMQNEADILAQTKQ